MLITMSGDVFCGLLLIKIFGGLRLEGRNLSGKFSGRRRAHRPHK
jgi:hypothetical protein